jgi:glycosidase
MATTSPKRAWWKEASVYQIYPASFSDSNGDGFGDIPGIISKLPYLQKLGVDVIWVCPIYQSPQVDMGYDISDYRKIHKPYGTVEDVELLVKEARTRGMKVLST